MNINYHQPLGVIDKQTYRYLSLTKAYPQRSFLCDSCGVEYHSATFYSLAYHESELPHKRVYCENCLKATPKGQKRCRLKIKKLMPKIEKVKNKKPLPVALKVTKKKTKPKPSPVEYYNCLLASAQQDWFDPQTGKKKKITACCQDCKTKAPALNKQREQEITKLINSYRQTGVSLSKLLRPIK